MQMFQGSHRHARSDALIHYAGDFEAHEDSLRWSATLQLDGATLGRLGGTTGYGSPSLEAIHAVLRHLHGLIDARDDGAVLRPPPDPGSPSR